MKKTHMVVNKKETTNYQSSKKRFTALVGDSRQCISIVKHN